jgi:hypothetical protein
MIRLVAFTQCDQPRAVVVDLDQVTMAVRDSASSVTNVLTEATSRQPNMLRTRCESWS